jgi:hypothetical membrane protein
MAEGEPRSDALTTWLAAGGIVGPLLYVAAFSVAGWLRPGYVAIHEAVSDLGLGPNAWLVNGAGVLNWLLLTGWIVAFLRRTRTRLPAAWRWTSGALLELPPLGYAVASIYTEARATLFVHTYVGAVLGLLSPVVVFFVAGLALRRIERWRDWSTYSFIASVATLGLAGLMLWVWAPSAPPLASRFEGLMERVVIVETLAWYVVGGAYLARSDRRVRHTPAQ